MLPLINSIMKINRIEQAEGGGLSISYVYLRYKTIDSISFQPAFIHMPGHIYSTPEWTEFRNGPEHISALTLMLVASHLTVNLFIP